MSADQRVSEMPLPGRQFQRFIMVFHVVFVGATAFVLLNRWSRPTFTWTPQDSWLTTLVALQLIAYLGFLVFGAKRSSLLRWWPLYFAAVFPMWFASWRLEPGLEWLVLAYLGHLYGMVKPRFSIPIGLAVFTAYLGTKIGWHRLTNLNWQEITAYASLVVGWTALGLFLHRLVHTSSERAKLIQELQAAREELERARLRDAELAALQERERLARELHDSLGHRLVTLSVQLEAAQRLYAVDPGKASALLDEMKALLRGSMEELRRSLAGLRAPGLGDRNLDEALRRCCEETSRRAGLPVACEVSGDTRGLPPGVAEVLWRVAQESLANVEKHAHATNAAVSLRLDAPSATPAGTVAARQVVLRVNDDGVGLPPEAESKPGHYGLRGLRERVEGIGGSFNTNHGDRRGTMIEARIPVLS